MAKEKGQTMADKNQRLSNMNTNKKKRGWT